LPARSQPIPGGVGPTGRNPYCTPKASLRGERFLHF
jgi:hypothetical protein